MNSKLTIKEALKLVKQKSEFKVDFDSLWQWCGYTRKDNAKKVLTDNFERNFDFSCELRKNPSRGRPKEIITLTLDAAKEFAMLAQTPQGKEVRKYFIQAEKEARDNTRLYPDRSTEYKELYRELKDIIKKTKGGKHHYIHLNQMLNRVVGKIEGRTNNTISEVENLAYVLVMRKAIKVGNIFLKGTNGKNTRLAINKQIEKLKPQLKAIQDNLKLLS